MFSWLSVLISKLYIYAKRKYYASLYESYREKYSIDPSFRFNGFDILFYGEGRIICGANSYIGYNSFAQSITGRTISIGSNCAISHNVKIYTSSYITDQNFNELNRQKKSGDVLIGNGVWIGVNVYIGPGVSIGDNSVIGANSVITKDVPEFAIIAGAPSRVIRYKNIQ